MQQTVIVIVIFIGKNGKLTTSALHAFATPSTPAPNVGGTAVFNSLYFITSKVSWETPSERESIIPLTKESVNQNQK